MEEVEEAVQARAGIFSIFAYPVVEIGEILATAVQRPGRTLKVVGKRAPRLLWQTGAMKVSSTQGRRAGLGFDDEALAGRVEILALR